MEKQVNKASPDVQLEICPAYGWVHALLSQYHACGITFDQIKCVGSISNNIVVIETETCSENHGRLNRMWHKSMEVVMWMNKEIGQTLDA